MKVNKKWMIVIVILCLVILSVLLFFKNSSKDITSTITENIALNVYNLRIGTGNVGGKYDEFGKQLSEELFNSNEKVLNVRNTAGSITNLRLLKDNYIDMAIVQSDILRAATENGINNVKISDVHVVTGLYEEGVHIIVPANSKIESVLDLRNHKVSVGNVDSGTYINAVELMKIYGIENGDIFEQNMSLGDSAEALKSGNIDALFFTGDIGTKEIKELSDSFEIKLIEISDEMRKRIISNNDSYVNYTIPAGTYKGQEKDINTVGVIATLIANNYVKSEDEKIVLTAVNNILGDKIVKADFTLILESKDKAVSNRKKLEINMYITLALAVVVLYIGNFMRRKINFLDKFCIPAPVIGGLIFAIISCVLYALGLVEFNFDESFKNICMIIFFTSVGFQANFKVLKTGGWSLIIFLMAIILLIICQNGIGIGLSKVLGISPLIGMCTGSIPMVGGHGTSGAFGQVLEDMGLNGATTLCTAAATYGLIAGSFMGGPLARKRIIKKDLLKTVKNSQLEEEIKEEDEIKHIRKVSMYAPAVYQLAIAMGVGTIVSMLLSKTGMTFPVYIGAMIVAAFMRNIGEYGGKITIHMGEINDIGNICLSLFLGIAMVTLKLWQLADLALPLVVLLLAQTVFMMFYSYFVIFNACGRNYDAAVLTAGTCGFGMGATPNAMANMQAITDKYAPSVHAYLLVPIVGSMFADFINSLVITIFINII